MFCGWKKRDVFALLVATKIVPKLMMLKYARRSLLFQHRSAALRGGPGNGANTLEDIMTKFGNAIAEEQNKKRDSTKESHFARRLVSEELKRELLSKETTLDSMKEAMIYLSEAQENQESLEVVARKLKRAVGKIHSFLNDESRIGQRRLVEDAVTGAAFEESVKGLFSAIGEDDTKAYEKHEVVVKQGFRDAIAKLHNALENENFEGREAALGPRLLAARNDPEMMGALMGPAKAATAATKAVARLLDDTSVGGAQVTFDDANMLDYLGMLWILPFSIVGGAFFWATVGIRKFYGVYPIWQILVLEIRWFMDIVGCVVRNDIACGAWTGAPDPVL